MTARAAVYAWSVAELLACPFCRELYTPGEANQCSVCGVPLAPLAKLPPSLDAEAEALARGERAVPPEERVLPPSYLGRGRGALMVLSVLGLVSFCLPWVVMSRPEIAEYSGLELAKTRVPYLWGGAVGWFVLLPLVWTRRSILAMRGVRIIAALFSVLTLSEVLMLVLLTPRGADNPRVAFEWGYGLWISAAVSLVATVVAARFGGSVQRVEALPWSDRDARTETADGETVH
jgi:hypothetical protein